MESILVPALTVAFVAALVVAIAANHLRWKKRAERWAAAAVELGLSVGGGIELMDRFGSLPFSQKGRRRRVRNLIHGSTWGPEAWLGDFQWVTGSGKSQRTHQVTFCLLRDRELSLPQFELRPENAVLDAFAGVLGLADVDFDEDPDFSKSYRLTGPDEAAIRAAFNPSVRWQLVQRPSPVAHLEGSGEVLIIHPGRLVDPSTARELLRQAREIHAFFSA